MAFLLVIVHTYIVTFLPVLYRVVLAPPVLEELQESLDQRELMELMDFPDRLVDLVREVLLDLEVSTDKRYILGDLHDSVCVCVC